MFDYLLYASLIIFLLGLIYKASNWFTKSIGIDRRRHIRRPKIEGGSRRDSAGDFQY